jgi:hypothetical protein
VTTTSNRPSLPDLPGDLLALGGKVRVSITRYAMRAADEAFEWRKPATTGETK